MTSMTMTAGSRQVCASMTPDDFIFRERRKEASSFFGVRIEAESQPHCSHCSSAASSKHVGPSCMPPRRAILHPPGRLKRRNGSIPNDEEIDAGDCQRAGIACRQGSQDQQVCAHLGGRDGSRRQRDCYQANGWVPGRCPPSFVELYF